MDAPPVVPTLREVLDGWAWSGDTPPPSLLALVAATCRVLAAAHGEGHAHGGLTPAAIGVAGPDQVLLWPAAASAAPGTPSADLHALGAILHECIAGAAPDGTRGLRELAPGCPDDLVTLVDALLSSDAALRPASAGDVLVRLAPFLPAAMTTVTSAVPGPTVDRRTLPTVARTSYAVERELARGGLGKVLVARDTRLERPVAVKELLVTDRDRTDGERFVREAFLTARLQHPGIVPIYEAGVWPSGEPFYAMRLVSGKPLSDALHARHSLAERLALLPNVLAVAQAVAYAHDQRIVHRDLKPHNVLVGEFGETVVIDWGLAKDLRAETVEGAPPRLAQPRPSDDDSGASTLTQVGAVLGTPAYMPPEQARGEPIDERADVYALGAILYHLLAGRPPYTAWSGASTLAALLEGPPAPVRSRAPGAPRDLVALVEKAMARAPAERYPSAKELAADLQRFQTGQLVLAHRYGALERVARFLRRHRGPVGVAGVALVILLVFVVLSFRRIVREERLASERADALALISVRSLIERDPARALSVLAVLSPEFKDWGAARVLAAAALAQPQPRVITGCVQSARSELAAVDLASDGSAVACLAANKTTMVFDLGERAGTLTLPGRGDDAGLVKLSPDGKALVTLDNALLQVWDLDCVRGRGVTACPPRHLPAGGGEDRVAGLHVIFSPDGKTLFWTASSNTVRVLELETGSPATLAGHTDGVTAMIVSPDGKDLLTGSRDGTVRDWDLATSAGRVLLHPSGLVWRLARSSDGRRFAATGTDNIVHVARLTPGGPGDGPAPSIAEIAPVSYVAEMTFSPDGGRLAYVGQDDKVRVWNGTSGETAVLSGHENQLLSVDFSPDGTLLAAAGLDPTIRVWSTRSGYVQVLAGHQTEVDWLRFTADGDRLISASLDGELRVWRLGARSRAVLGGPERSPLYATDAVRGVFAYSPDGRWLVHAGPDQTLLLRDTHGDGERELTTPDGAHDAVILRVAFAPDGATLATASADGAVRVFNVADGAGRVVARHTLAAESLAYSADSRRVASGGGDGVVNVADLGGAVRAYRGLPGRVMNVAFSPDGKSLAATDFADKVVVWDLQSGTLRDLPWVGGGIHDLTYAPLDGALYADGSDVVTVWRDGKPPERWAHDAWVSRLALSRDGALAAVACTDSTIVVWDARTGARRRVLRGHLGDVRAVAFSPDGSSLVSGGEDGTVRLWDVATGESRVLRGHERPVIQVAFSPDGATVASWSLDGSIRLWDDDLPRDPTALRAVLRRNAEHPIR